MTENQENNNSVISMGTSAPAADVTIEVSVILWPIIDIFIFIMIVCGNGLTIAALRLNRRLRSVVSNQFILSLAISDMLVGLTIPHHMLININSILYESPIACIMNFCFITISCCVSIWNLLAIGIDRYIAVVHPLHYNRLITKRNAFIVIVSGWIFGILLGAIPALFHAFVDIFDCEFDLFLPKWYMIGMVPGFFLIWICMLMLYWRIWREAYKHAKKLGTKCPALHGTEHSSRKSVQVVLLVLVCFTVCWLPHIVVAFLQICGVTTNNKSSSVTLVLVLANSGMNPFIYAWKSRQFRRTFNNLMRCRVSDSHM